MGCWTRIAPYRKSVPSQTVAPYTEVQSRHTSDRCPSFRQQQDRRFKTYLSRENTKQTRTPPHYQKKESPFFLLVKGFPLFSSVVRVPRKQKAFLSILTPDTCFPPPASPLVFRWRKRTWERLMKISTTSARSSLGLNAYLSGSFTCTAQSMQRTVSPCNAQPGPCNAPSAFRETPHPHSVKRSTFRETPHQHSVKRRPRVPSNTVPAFYGISPQHFMKSSKRPSIL